MTDPGVVQVVVASPFADDTIARFRGVSPRLELVHAPTADQATIDRLAGPDTQAIVGPLLPSNLARTPRLRWLQLLSAGAERVADGFPTGIALTNARGCYGGAIAQYTLAAILRIAEQADARAELQRRHEWPADEDRYLGRLVRGQTVVIVGYGGIGREIGRLAAAHGMRVLAVKARPDERRDTSYRHPGTGDPEGTIPERIVGLDRLAEVAAEADFMTVTLPLAPGSRGVVSREVIAALPAHAWVTNTGRGPVIDEAALLQALRERRIGGAVLDVFSDEPLPADHELWALPNVIITPHVAGAAAETEIAELVAENLRRFVAGEPLLNDVDPVRGY